MAAISWSGLTAGNGYYVIGINATTSCVSPNSNNVNVTNVANPAALVLTGSTVCATPGNNGTITSTTSEAGVNYQLYDSGNLEVGNPIAGTGSGLLWTGISVSNGYYIVGTNTTTTCSSANSNAVNVTSTANPTITSSATAATLCFNSSSQSATLAYSATNGSPTTYTINWNAAAHTAGLVDVASTSLPVTPISLPVVAGLVAGTYTGTLTVYAGSCSSIGNSFTLTVNSAPSAPTGSATQTFCSGATVANLSATGTAILWYAASSGGSALTTSTGLVNGTHYYASQTVSGCESSSRLDVTALVVSAGSWIGTTSTDWFTTSNWCGGTLPTSSTDVTIAAGLSHYPSIGATGSAVCNSITSSSVACAPV